MKRASFRTRLTLLNALVVLGVLGATGFVLTWSTAAFNLGEIDRELGMRADRLTRPRGGPDGPVGPGGLGGPGGPFRIPRGGGDAPERPRFFTPEGAPLAEGEPAPPLDSAALLAPGARRFTTVEREGQRYRVVTTPAPGPDGGTVLLQVGHQLGDYDRMVAAQRTLLLALIPFAILVAGAAGWYLAHRALKPVADVTDAAGRLGNGDLEQRLLVEGDDELARLAATFNEMSARLQSSFAQKEALLREVQDALEQQKRFVADASHELRTPLARLRLTTSAALAQEASESEVRDALQVSDAAAVNLTRLVDQLLVLARTESEVQQPEAVDLREVVAEAVGMFQEQDGAAIQAEPCPLAPVVGSRPDLVRALVNLIENARRATPLEGTIRVRVFADGGHARLEVSDTGPGVPAEHLPRLTERFYRIDAARSRDVGGTGLGLAIVRAIAERHGGRLELASPPGGGFTATIVLAFFGGTVVPKKFQMTEGHDDADGTGEPGPHGAHR